MEFLLCALNSAMYVIRCGKLRYCLEKINTKMVNYDLIILFVILVPDHAVCY